METTSPNLFKILIYLFWKSYRKWERDREREKSHVCWFTSQMTALCRVDVRNQHFILVSQIAKGAQTFVPCSFAFTDLYKEAGSEEELPDMKQHPFEMWRCRLHFYLCITMLTPKFHTPPGPVTKWILSFCHQQISVISIKIVLSFTWPIIRSLMYHLHCCQTFMFTNSNKTWFQERKQIIFAQARQKIYSSS